MIHVDMQGTQVINIPFELEELEGNLNPFVTEFKRRVLEEHGVDVEVQTAWDEQNRRMLIREKSDERGIATYEITKGPDGFRFIRII